MHKKKKSKIERGMLEADLVREAVKQSGHHSILRSEEEIVQSMEKILEQAPPTESVWIFGYGSLIWNPMLEYERKVHAKIFGYHRGFYLWSKINRGTPEKPGLVLALDRGGSCEGVAFELKPKNLRKELLILWRREMISKAYVPKWVRLKTSGGPLSAVTFIIDRGSSSYTGKLSDSEIVSIAARASGHYGSCSEYLLETAECLTREKIRDHRLASLAGQLRTFQGSRHASD